MGIGFARGVRNVFFLLCLVLAMFAWGRSTGPSIAPDLRSSPALPGAHTGPRLDRFGNTIEDALNDYRIDGHGELYESHSPDTSVGQLGAPII